MDMLPVLLVLFSITGGALSATNGTNVTITTDAPPGMLDPGIVVKVTCLATEAQALDVMVLKALRPGGPVTVVTNLRPEKKFRDRKQADGANRYSTTYTFDNDAQKLKLVVTISGIQPEDSGKFFCELLSGSKQISRTITLPVKTPVSNVSMATVFPNNTLEVVPDGGMVTLTHGTKSGVACVVTLESYVYRRIVNITVNGKPSPVDFISVPGRRVEGTESMYEFTYKYVTSSPHYTMDGAVVECTAFTPAYSTGVDVKKAQVTGNATYLPVILCSDLMPVVQEGGVGVITCTVWSNPKVSLLQVNFGLTILAQVVDFELGTTNYQKYTLTREDGEKSSTVSFTIQGMTAVFFDQYLYMIKAESSVGETTQSFSFKRDIVSSSCTCTSSWLLMTFASLMVIAKVMSSPVSL